MSRGCKEAPAREREREKVWLFNLDPRECVQFIREQRATSGVRPGPSPARLCNLSNGHCLGRSLFWPLERGLISPCCRRCATGRAAGARRRWAGQYDKSSSLRTHCNPPERRRRRRLRGPADAMESGQSPLAHSFVRSPAFASNERTNERMAESAIGGFSLAGSKVAIFCHPKGAIIRAPWRPPMDSGPLLANLIQPSRQHLSELIAN